MDSHAMIRKLMIQARRAWWDCSNKHCLSMCPSESSRSDQIGRTWSPMHSCASKSGIIQYNESILEIFMKKKEIHLFCTMWLNTILHEPLDTPLRICVATNCSKIVA
ncbi:hypothetical protein NPIL_589621 [Nephila pilipes]|uniref:Uncharacterized protein n=1 Tax=Nephila pilipes TaxID=299642 RepID=A0A8X6Q4M3_NEPPI|nr:hypothetical protein NPIL_589621 [Nephila pilipes]